MTTLHSSSAWSEDIISNNFFKDSNLKFNLPRQSEKLKIKIKVVYNIKEEPAILNCPVRCSKSVCNIKDGPLEFEKATKHCASPQPHVNFCKEVLWLFFLNKKRRFLFSACAVLKKWDRKFKFFIKFLLLVVAINCCQFIVFP